MRWRDQTTKGGRQERRSEEGGGKKERKRGAKGRKENTKREETTKRHAEEVKSCRPTSYSIVPRVLLLSRQTHRQMVG